MAGTSAFQLAGRWRWVEAVVWVAALVTGVLFLVEVGFWLSPGKAPGLVTSVATWLGVGVALWMLAVQSVRTETELEK